MSLEMIQTNILKAKKILKQFQGFSFMIDFGAGDMLIETKKKCNKNMIEMNLTILAID